MSFSIEPVTESDIPALTALNADNVPHVNLVDEAEMAAFLDMPGYFLKVTENGNLAGFVVALSPGAGYGSENYAWFTRQFADFLYIDRIMTHPHFRRRGVAHLIYQHLADLARENGTPRLTCEVNTRPPNPGSMAMHLALGFSEAGVQETDGGAKAVSLLAWELD